MMDKLNKILKEEAIFEGHSVEAREAIMEHVKRGVPLCDSIFRTHSDAYFETFNLARKLYKEGLLEGLDWESVEMLESNIGETAVVDGEVVYLDVPYLCEDEDYDDDEEEDHSERAWKLIPGTWCTEQHFEGGGKAIWRNSEWIIYSDDEPNFELTPLPVDDGPVDGIDLERIPYEVEELSRSHGDLMGIDDDDLEEAMPDATYVWDFRVEEMESMYEDDDEEKKIFFVKVGDGRDSMTVKTKAKNKSEALKKIRDEHPKERVSLDTNHDQGKPAEMLESDELDESHSVKDQIYDRYEELSGHRDNPKVKKHLAKADKCWQDGDVQGCMDALRAGEKLVAPKRESKDWEKQAADDASARLDNHKKKMPSVWKQMHKDAAELEKSKKRKEQMNEDSELDHIIRLLKS